MESSQDAFVIKAPKKSPLLLRTVVLLFATACGLYICSICLKQISPDSTRNKFLNIEVYSNEEELCRSDIESWEVPYVHFPKPKTYDREECACNPVRYFVIVSQQRSGSGWFETLLNNHTNVSSNGEIFNVRSRRENVSTIIQTMDQLYNLDWISSSSKNECSAAVGFKWMFNQGLIEHHELIADYFKKKGVSAIFLFRRNVLRRMISLLANTYDKDVKLLNGTHKSHVHSPAEVYICLSFGDLIEHPAKMISNSNRLSQAQLLAKYKPTINTTHLAAKLRSEERRIERAIEYFQGTRHIILYYEDVVKNRTKLRDVQELLRLPYTELQSRQVKIHVGPISKQVENWEEVQKTLNGSTYEHLLYSDDQMGHS